MKTAIVYSSKYGCTEDCAVALKSKLNDESDLFNLKTEKTIDLQQYDWVIIGSPIYVGQIQKEVKQFCERSKDILLTKNLALFLCCTTPEQVDDFFKINFSEDLLSHATQTVNLGGELRREKLGFLEKKIITMAEKMEPRQLGIISENIDALAAAVKSKY